MEPSFQDWFDRDDPDALDEDKYAAMRVRGQLRAAHLVVRDVLGVPAGDSATVAAVFHALRAEAQQIREELGRLPTEREAMH